MKIGIPLGLSIYEYPVLFVNFFKYLNIEVVFSEKTSPDILSNGVKYSLSESCLASKIFIGHVANLVDRIKNEKIDYIFIPRLCTFENNQTTCVKLFALYDICNNIFNANFLTLNIDYEKNSTELKAFLKLGKKINKKVPECIHAYLMARKDQKLYDKKKLDEQLKEINKQDSKKRVILVAHPYIAYDSILGKKVIQLLEKENVDVIFANINEFSMQNPKFFKIVKNKKYEYKNISETIFWKSSKNLLNGIYSNLNNIDGIVYLSVFPCGTDSLVNELAMRKIKDVPYINIVLDEQDADAGLQTRIESFVDILNMKERDEKVIG